MSILQRATNIEHVASILAPMLRQRLGLAQDQPLRLTVEVLRQRSRRAVLRYEIEATGPAQGTNGRWRVIGKLHEGGGVKCYEEMRKLWASGFSRDAADGISIPEAFAYLQTFCMILQEEVPGVAAREILRRSWQAADLKLVPRALAKLHQCPIDVARKPLTVMDLLRRSRPHHESLSLACPDLTSSIHHIVSRACTLEHQVGAVPLTLLHGDFHFGQVHLENGRAWLIDLDALSYGDPAFDVGHALAYLKSRARRLPEMAAAVAAFQDEYFSSMDRSIASRVPLYEALTELRRACRAMRLKAEAWRRNVEEMVELGVAAIDEMS